MLAGAIQAILLAVYLLLHANIRGGRTFAVLFLLLAIHLFLAANDHIDFFYSFPHLLHISWVLPGLYGPLILIFVKRITRYESRFSWKEALYFLPCLIIGIALLPFFMASAEAKRQLLAVDGFFTADFGWPTQSVTFLHMVYFGVAIGFYKRYHKNILNYATSEEARMVWLGSFLKLIMAVAVFGGIVFYAKKFEVPVIGAIYPHHFLGILVIIYWSAYKLIRQPAIFSSAKDEAGFVEVQEAAVVHEANKQTGAQHVQLSEQITALMEDEKLYRTQGLSLQELSTRVNSNKQYVSETINQVFGKNFYDYVNEYRLKEFTGKLDSNEDKNLTLLGIATNAGFNSKATFNAVFKKHHKMTPSEFQKMKQRQRKHKDLVANAE